jgi:hypothetical protein
MAEENNNPVGLGDLGSASSSDIRKALEGQPEPLQEPTVAEVPVIPEAEVKSQASSALGSSASNLMDNEDGSFSFVNPYDSNLDFDLDQFETKRRRVSEDSALSGILNGVEGLEQNFVYNGLEDTAKRSQEAQGVVNKMKNGFTQLTADTGLNMAQGFAALLYGVPSAIVNGDLTKLYDNSVANTLDDGAEFLDEFYAIKRGGEQSGVKKAANFVFDDLFGAASFVMGAIATEMVFSAATVATGGAAAPAQAAASVGLVARGTRLVQKALQGGKALMAGNLVDDALRASRALGAKVTREGASEALKKAAALARTPMAMQAAARVSRQLITGASMESGMEARHMLNSAVADQKQQHEAAYGEGSFTEEMSGEFREKISGYADGVFGTNMALVGASNMLMFPKLFGVGARQGMRKVRVIDTTKLTSKARARLAKNLGIVEGKLPRMVDAARGNTLGRIAGRTGEVGRTVGKNLKNAFYEGFVEEGGQGAISRSTEDYISKRYDPRGVNESVKFADSFLEGLKGSYTTKDGFKEIGIGMLLAFTGVPMYARNQKYSSTSEAETEGTQEKKWKWQMMGGYADQRKALMAQDKQMDAIMNLSEKHGDVGAILRQEVANMNRQNVLQREQDLAVAEGRFKDVKDIEADQIFSHATSKVVTGRYEQALAEGQQIMEEMSDEDLREQLGSDAKNMTSDELRTHRNKAMESYKARMGRARDAFEQAGVVYRGEDPDIHTGVAHMLYMAEEKDSREKTIAQEMALVIEDMNEGQILDMLRMRTELGLKESDMGNLVTLLNRNKDINKQLQTKLERKLIKEVDPEKAKAREESIASLQESLANGEQEITAMFDIIATANNVDRNKYEFDPGMLDSLADLHRAISNTTGVSYKATDLEELSKDFAGVYADRMLLIAAYNDFIKPGGVARFENRMIGSLEAMADMSPEELLERRQEAAAEEDIAADREEEAQAISEATVPPKESTVPTVGPTNPTGPSFDDGSGDFQAPSQAVSGEEVETGENFGFPDPSPSVPNVESIPINVGLGEARPVATPVATPVAESLRQSVGTVYFDFTNARFGSETNTNFIRPEYAAAFGRVISKFPIGSKFYVEREVSGTYNYSYKLPDGTLLMRVQELPSGIELVGNRVDLVTTNLVSREFAGGEKVATVVNGELAIENPYVNRKVSDVLPNGVQDVVGYGIARTDGEVLKINGAPELGVDVKKTEAFDGRFSGNLYVSTKDSLDGEVAWHTVKLAPFGKARATQMLQLILAFNQFAENKNEMSPEQIALWTNYYTAEGIDPTESIEEVSRAVIKRLRRTIPSKFNSEQKAKSAEAIIVRPLFAIEAIGKTPMIMVISYENGKAAYTHSIEGDVAERGFAGILAQLSNHRRNAVQEQNFVVMPDGKGDFEGLTIQEMVERYGEFTDRMPIVFEDKIYNKVFRSVGFTTETKTPVPTDKLTVARPEETVSAGPATMSINLDTLDFDPGDLSFETETYPSYLLDEAASDPMKRAGALYEVPGLTDRQLRDGINFGAGVMSRAFITHMRTKDRSSAVTADYLRRAVKVHLTESLAGLEARPQHPFYDQMIEAHKAYLDPAHVERLIDLSMVEMLRQSQGVIALRGKGTLEEALKALTTETPSKQMQEDLDAAERSENPMAAFGKNFAFSVDPRSTLGVEAKMLIMGLVDTSRASAQSVGLAGRRFVNSSELMGKMTAALVGVNPDFESVQARLEQYVPTYPQFEAVLKALQDEHALNGIPKALKANLKVQERALAVQDMIRNQFVNYASKEASTFDSAKIIRPYNSEDGMSDVLADIQIWNSNSRNMREHITSDMKSILTVNGFFNLDGTINQDRLKTFHKVLVDISALPVSDQAEATSKALEKELGIFIPAVALTSKNRTLNTKGNPFFKGIEIAMSLPKSRKGAYGKFRYALKELSESSRNIEDLLDSKSSSMKALVDFFVGIADYRVNFIQKSSKDGDNRVRHHFTSPKLLHQMVRKVQEEVAEGIKNGTPRKDILFTNRFGLLDLENQSKIGLTYLSGISLENRGNERDFHGMENGDSLLAQLTFYGNENLFAQQSAGDNSKKVMISKFLMPTLADKQTMPILQAPAMSAEMLGIKPLDEGLRKKPYRDVRLRDIVKSVKGAYTATLKKSVQFELDRVMRIQAGHLEGMTAAQRGAVGFVFMPGLNGLAKSFMDGKIKRKDFESKVHALAESLFEATINRDIQVLLEETKGTVWTESKIKTQPGSIGNLDFFDASKTDNFDNKKFDYVREHVSPQTPSLTKPMRIPAFYAFLAKYSMDSMNARTSLVVDVVGDPGAFVSLQKDGTVNASKTATNLGKRFASLIAPGTAIPYVKYRDRNGKLISNSTVSFLVIPKREVPEAAHYAYLKKLGQTPDELATQKNYDSADAAEYTTVEEHLGILYAEGKMTRIEMAGILGKIKRGETLDDNGLGLFQPMKPVTTARVGDHLLYVKSAAFPLVPQLTQGTELDKLRVFMEKNNIQRAAYDSAMKVGNEWTSATDENALESQRMVPVHVGAEVVISKGLESRVIRGVDRKYMRIQQQVPVSKSSEKVHGSQVAKHFLVDLGDSTFMYNGNKIKGTEMYGEYISARSEEQAARLELFAQKYEMAFDPETKRVSHTAESRKKFAERITEEAISREYDANETAHLYFDEATNRFSTPLEAGPSQARIEDLIKSIIFQEVYEPSMEGFSGPIRPEVGIKSLDDALVNSGDIMWVIKGGTRLFDGIKLKVAQEGQLDQIIMPWKYKASLEKYMVDGNIDADKLPAELLKTFAYRIPNQGKSSSTAFEIVGFLPETYGDTLIVNEELIGRMGQDYDIDKMHGFLYAIEQAEDGTISVIRDTESTLPTQQTTEVKEGVSELFESNSELAEIGTPAQYSDYLDTVFPDSKVKDILYHMTSKEGKKGIEEKGRFLKPGEEGYKKADYATTGGIYFTDNNSYDEDTEMYGSPVTGAYGSTYVSTILNIKNPLIDLNKSFGDISKAELKNYDGFIGTNESKEIGVLEPEQIHTLGSKQDIEGFKEFVGKPAQQTSEVGKALVEDVVNDNSFTHRTSSIEAIETWANSGQVVGRGETINTFNDQVPATLSERVGGEQNRQSPNFQRGKIYGKGTADGKGGFVIISKTDAVTDEDVVPNRGFTNQLSFDKSRGVGVVKPNKRGIENYDVYSVNEDGSLTKRDWSEFKSQPQTSDGSKPASASRRVAIARNKQVDLYIASMESTDLAVQQSLHAPVTDGYAVQLAAQLDAFVHTDAETGMPMSIAYNMRKAEAARSAQATIGTMAVHMVTHAQINQAFASLQTELGEELNWGEYLEGGDTFIEIVDSPGQEFKKTPNTKLGSSPIHDTTFVLNYTTSKGKKYTPKAGNRSAQFSRMVNHAVDNENNGLLDKLGITKATWSIWTGLTHMGYNQETIGLLVAMPGVQRYLDLKSRSGRLGDSTQVSVRDVMNEFTEQLDPKVDEGYPTLDKQSMLEIAQGTSELSDREQQLLNQSALNAVFTLELLAEDLGRVQNFLRLDTKRPKTLLDVQILLAKMQLTKESKFEGHIVDVKGLIRIVEDNTVGGLVTKQVDETFKSLFDVDNNLLNQYTVKGLVKALYEADTFGSLEEKAGTIVKGAKSMQYAYFTQKLMGKSSEQIRKEAHDVTTGGIAQRLISMRVLFPEVAENSFIKQLSAVRGPNKYPHIEFPGDRQLESNSLEVHRGFLALLRSSNPEVKAFAEELVGYALATSSGRLKSRGYLKYVPAEYLQSKGLGEIVNNSGIQEQLSKRVTLTEILRHNLDLVPRYSTNDPILKNLFTQLEGVKVVVDSAGSHLFGHIRVGTTLYAPVSASYEMELGDGKKTNVYPVEKVTALGDYLSEEYTVGGLPANHKQPVKQPKTSQDRGMNSIEEPLGNFYDEAPGNVDPYANQEVPMGLPSNAGLGTNEFNVSGPPAGMSLGTAATPINDKIVRTENDGRTPMSLGAFLRKSTVQTNPFITMLANAQEALKDADRVKIVIDPGLKEKGAYDPNTHTIRIKPAFVHDARTVTHELVHAFTVLGIEIDAGRVQMSDPKKKAAIKEAVAEIKLLYKLVSSEASLKEMGLDFAEYQRAMRGMRAYKAQTYENAVLTDEQKGDVQFLRANLDKYYGLTSLKEFIAEAFSNKEFAERIARIKSTREKSFLTRFLEAVNKVLKALGIDMYANTEILRAVYGAAMGLINIQLQNQISLQTDVQLPTSALLDSLNVPDIGGHKLESLPVLLKYKEKRIRQFEELKSRYKSNREFVRRVEARLLQERKDLARLSDDSVEVTPEYMFAIGQRELDFARKTIDSVNSSDPQITMALSALENIHSVVEFYGEARKHLTDESLKDVATALRRDASELLDNYLDKAKEISRLDADKVFENTGVTVDSDTFETVKQTSFLGSRFLDASRQGVTELSYLDKIVRDAAGRQRAEFNRRAKKYMDGSNKYKKTNYFKKHGWNGLVQLDTKGNPTANVLSMLTGKFDSDVKIKLAEFGGYTSAFFNWQKSVTARLDIDSLFDITGDTVKRKKNPPYEASLKKKFGMAAAAEYLAQQESMLQEYMDARTSEFDTLELSLGVENAAEGKALWELQNSPVNAYRRSEGKLAYVKNSTTRFLLNMPLQAVKGKDTGYYDARFLEMLKEQDAQDFYTMYREQMKDLLGMLPAHKMQRESHLIKAGLFIPAISKSLTRDIFSREGLVHNLKTLPDTIKGAFTIDSTFDINKLIDPVTGRPRQELPTYFLGQVDPKTQEYDMDKTFLAFAMMATTYDSKNAIEDKVRMTKSVMGKANVVSKETFKDKVLGKIGLKTATKFRDAASKETLMKSVDTLVDTFYGYSSADVTKTAPRGSWTAKQKATIDKLNADLSTAKTDDEKAAILKKIEDATPRLSAAKAVGMVQQFVQAKGMAWNIPAATVNMVFGALSVWKHASGQRDFNEKHVRQASIAMLHSTLNNMSLNTGATRTAMALKIQNMMVMLDVLKDFTEMRYDVRKFVKQSGEAGVNQAARQGFNKLRMYEIQRSSEFYVYGMGTMAILLKQEVNGKSLWEHMDSSGVIQLDGYRPGEAKFLELVAHVDQVNKRIHGNYDPNSPIAIKKTLVGRLMMQFRSWLPEAVATRFESEKYDPYLDRVVKGSFVTMFSAEWKQNLKAMMPMLLPSWVRTKGMNEMSEEISETDQENIRRFAAGLRQYMQVMILYAVLSALKDDEDDEDSLRLLNYGLNVTDRVENDLALFGSPGAFLSMTQGDFLAVIGAASDAEKFGDAVAKTIQGDGTIETGTYAGDSRMGHHFKKLVPHLGAVQRMQNNLDREMNTGR